MPQGQTLGERRWFRYDTDKDTPFKILLDQTLGAAGGLEEDDTGNSLPKRFEPRYVWVEGEVGGEKVRKRIVCSRTSSLYSSVPTNVTIDGVQFRSTGRVGEKQVFGTNPVAAAPGG